LVHLKVDKFVNVKPQRFVYVIYMTE